MAADPLKQLAKFDPAAIASTAAQSSHRNIFNSLAFGSQTAVGGIAKGSTNGRRSLS
jgi:hypothetical protein